MTPRTQGSDFEAREERIVDAVRDIAEEEGWSAVTVRRLADEIGFSQPILYKHFPRGREEMVERVVVDGFTRLLAELGVAASAAPDDRLRSVIDAYLRFARQNPAVYAAMSTALTSIEFATDETPRVLRDGFEVLRLSVGDGPDSVVRAELLWAMLHGVGELARHGRLDPELEEARIDAMVGLFGPVRSR